MYKSKRQNEKNMLPYRCIHWRPINSAMYTYISDGRLSTQRTQKNFWQTERYMHQYNNIRSKAHEIQEHVCRFIVIFCQFSMLINHLMWMRSSKLTTKWERDYCAMHTFRLHGFTAIENKHIFIELFPLNIVDCYWYYPARSRHSPCHIHRA